MTGNRWEEKGRRKAEITQSRPVKLMQLIEDTILTP
jgi:hypothetical protein